MYYFGKFWTQISQGIGYGYVALDSFRSQLTNFNFKLITIALSDNYVY